MNCKKCYKLINPVSARMILLDDSYKTLIFTLCSKCFVIVQTNLINKLNGTE